MLSWKDVYSVGEETLDKQHKEIINMVNVIDEMSYSKDVDFSELFREIDRKARIHFSDEEVYMEKIGFPNLGRHKQYHEEILEGIDVLMKRFKAVEDEEGFKEIITKFGIFLRDVVISHLLGLDQEYHLYYKSKMLG